MLRPCRLPLQLRPAGKRARAVLPGQAAGSPLKTKPGMWSKINPPLAQKRRQCRVKFCRLSLRLKPLALHAAVSARSKKRCRFPSPRSSQGASTSAYRPDPPGSAPCTKSASSGSRFGPPNLRLGQLSLLPVFSAAHVATKYR